MMHIDTINIRGWHVRGRSKENMLLILNSVHSCITYKSHKAEVLRCGEWERCMLSLKISDVYTGFVEALLRFDDGVQISQTGKKETFLLLDDLLAVERDKEERKRSRKKVKGKSKVTGGCFTKEL